MADDVVAGAGRGLPGVGLGELGEAGGLEPAGELGHRVAGGGRGVDEGAQVVAQDELIGGSRHRHIVAVPVGRGDRPRPTTGHASIHTTSGRSAPDGHEFADSASRTRPTASAAGGMLAGVSEPTLQPIVAEPAGFPGPDELAAALESTGTSRRGARDGRLPGAGDAPPAVPGGRGGRREDGAGARAGRGDPPSAYRLQCYEGLEASQALYDWDFGRQLLHLRAAEAAHANDDPASLEASLYDRRFLLARPLLQALEDSPSVLLVDEVDRADDESRRSSWRFSRTSRSPSRSSAPCGPSPRPW